jgi:hypothetical protein
MNKEKAIQTINDLYGTQEQFAWTWITAIERVGLENLPQELLQEVAFIQIDQDNR